MYLHHLRDRKELGTTITHVSKRKESKLEDLPYSLLLCKITGSSQDNDNSVVLQFERSVVGQGNAISHYPDETGLRCQEKEWKARNSS